jgi:hypothetical protein
MAEWRGYRHRNRGIEMVYSVQLDDFEFNKLWEKFKNWKGSQEEFYLTEVNPMKLKQMR